MLRVLESTIPIITRTSPVGTIVRDMDHMLHAAPSRKPASWPAMNVWREGETIVAEAEIPGFRMEDIEVLATERALTIRGQREPSTDERALRVERLQYRFERTLDMPLEIDAEATEASLAHGVLRITLPLAERVRPRRVQVRAPNAPQVTEPASH